VTSQLPSDSQGITLPELLIAAAISLLTATVAGDLLISHIRSSERAEAMERQRSDWSRTTTFIEAEVALSERVIGAASNIAIPTACGFSDSQFRLGLDLRRDLPPVVYAIRSIHHRLAPPEHPLALRPRPEQRRLLQRNPHLGTDPGWPGWFSRRSRLYRQCLR